MKKIAMPLLFLIIIIVSSSSAHSADIFCATVVDNKGFEMFVENIKVRVPSGWYQLMPGKRGLAEVKIPFALISAMEFFKTDECGEYRRKVILNLKDGARIEICTYDAWMYLEGKTQIGDFKIDHQDVKEVTFR